MECTGTTNSAAESAGTLAECRAMAEAGEYEAFGYNPSKGKCYGVSEDTAAGCTDPVEDTSEKWNYYTFWCSEGHTTAELCEADKLAKGAVCDTENVVEDVMDLDDCLEMATDLGLAAFAYSKKFDDCYLPTGTTDGGMAACTDGAQSASKKYKTYEVACGDVEYISKQYYCDQNDYLQITMVAEETKCSDISTADGFEATVAECNDFAFEDGMDWFAYREEMNLCWIPQNAAQDRSCRNTGLSTGKVWNVYAACGLLPEQLSDEEAACQGKVGCAGEDCFVMWRDSEESWKCQGANQDHTGEHFQVCVDLALDNQFMWMNYRTNNGACAVEDSCIPVESGSNWQILLNCDVVLNQ